MPLFIPPPMEVTQVFLELDGLFLFAARQHLARAKPGKGKIGRLTQRLLRLHDKAKWLTEDDEDEYGNRRRRNLDSYHDDLVTLSYQIEDTFGGLVKAFRPMWQHCAEAILLSAFSVEAHMNRRIVELVRASATREKLNWIRPPERKMQEILTTLGKKRFGQNDKPFSNFKQVIAYRNNLAHYKPKFMVHDDGRPPKLPLELGLLPREATKAVRMAGDLIEAFSKRLEVDAPSWVRRKHDHFFSLV